MHWLADHLAILERTVDQFMARETGMARTMLASLFTKLEDDERLMVRFLNGERPPESESGTLEFGPVLHLVDSWLSKEHPAAYAALKSIGLPSSTIEPGDYARWAHQLETCGIVAGDGTLFATPAVARFAQFDPGWPASAAEYLLATALGGLRYPFPHDNPAVLSVAGRGAMRIAVAGDWGSGPWGEGPWGPNDHGMPAPAMLIRDQIGSQQPDITIHLGDVYYGGTHAEQSQYLSACWPPGRLASFTLNSNHEMFDGGRGYFETALAPNGVFGRQRGTSYFAIESDDWAVIGLDTAYHDRSAGFMDGALTDPYQIDFLRTFKRKAHLVILSHHNALNTSGTALVPNPSSGRLWDNVVDALDGRHPDFWYWGHVHNGIAYKTVPWDASNGPAPATKCRCVGHGALPFGRAYFLDEQPDNIEYAATTKWVDPVTPYQTLRVKNGWAMLTLDSGGLREEFWEVGDAAPAWHATHAW